MYVWRSVTGNFLKENLRVSLHFFISIHISHSLTIALLPGVNTAPAHSHTAPAHPHYCPCPPAATTDWPCIRPCFSCSVGRSIGWSEKFLKSRAVFALPPLPNHPWERNTFNSNSYSHIFKRYNETKIQERGDEKRVCPCGTRLERDHIFKNFNCAAIEWAKWVSKPVNGASKQSECSAAERVSGVSEGT